MKLFLGVDGGQSATKALIGDETGRILGSGKAGPCNHATAAEGRAKLERAVLGCVAEACEQASLDAASVRFEAACFGMSGGPEDKQAILAEILRTERLVVTTDAVIALAGATEKGQGIITIWGRGRLRSGETPPGRLCGRAAGATFMETKAAPSTSDARRCGPRFAWRKAGVRRPGCWRCCSPRPVPLPRMKCFTGSTHRIGRDNASRDWLPR